MPTAHPFHPHHTEAIEAIWQARYQRFRQLQLAAGQLGNAELEDRLGNLRFCMSQRLQQLHHMRIDYQLHNGWYMPNPIDWNRGRPTLVSTLKPVKA